MNNPATDPDAISDRDLVLNFENIGDNCEFGLVQRMAGAEPLGLLRFSSTPIRFLVRALRARFEGLTDPANVRVWSAKNTYLIALTKYEFVYHAHIHVGEIDPEVLHQQQTRILPFLVKKLIEELENPEKILVFRQNEPMAANDLIDLRTALASFGPATLLWVQEARPGHPAGTVDQIENSFMTGYVRRLASRENAPDLDLASWLTTLRRAYALWRARSTPLPADSVNIMFGTDGNARAFTQYGWSPPEDGHTFAIDDRSLLTIAAPADAEAYRLEMDISPFTAPPALPSQRLDIVINGQLLQTIDPVTDGIAVCAVPGTILRGHERVEILLVHPRAARPCDVAGTQDTRRLAIMFRRLTLTGTQAATRPGMVEIVFGPDGQPRTETEFGWSPPEADFTWSVDDRSLLIVAPPADALNYRLDIDMRPFVYPPALESQSLEVSVNGTPVHTFDPVAVGVSSCVVPGRLIHGRDRVEFLLTHPRAARPDDLGAGRDARRLAIMFRRLALVGLAE